jgi:hypothetical protein
MPRPDQYADIEAILSRRSYEEDAEISDQTAESMRFHAAGLRARCRYAEDRPTDDNMITISVRWARVIAKGLEQGAEAKELFDA